MPTSGIAALQTRIGYRFESLSLLEEALTHPGAAIQQQGRNFNYQRLEFLGDAVLGLLMADMLLEMFPDENEGEIARRHAALVSSPALMRIAAKLELARCLIAGKDAITGQGVDDACEALLGALYLDGGLDAARTVFRKYWEPLAREVTAPPKDAKTALQEWAQGSGYGLPVYRVVEQTGPAHAPRFICEVVIAAFPPVSGNGTSKRLAEQASAKAMLENLP